MGDRRGGIALRSRELGRGAVLGVAAGLVGAAAMTAGEKLEQVITHRPDSFVPARALLTVLGRRPEDAAQPVLWNHLMHWGTAATLGVLRGVWSVTGIRGVVANIGHTAARLAFDQTVENVTGVGAPPTTWPWQEQVVDVVHKAVYSVVTGIVADRLITPVLESSDGRTSH